MLLVICGLIGWKDYSGPYAVRQVQSPTVAGRSIRLALLQSSGEYSEVCEEVVVQVSGGWMLQVLGVRACSGHDRIESLDPKRFEIEPGPTAGSFQLFAMRTIGDSAPQRFLLGVYRIGLGERLVRLAGGNEPR